ncbi:MAG: hypothetical protein KF809_13660 [Chloroflexi bacterium]|nr:hypothetical protein [Chloroflexota bacterium]
MSALPRVLAIMGSGETAPTMAKVHRQLVARLPQPVRGVVLDTPYGFQENADELTAKALGYFRHHIGVEMGLATLRGPTDDVLTRTTTLDRVRSASYLFAGPGSPTYALDVWRATELPGLVAERLARGGVVVFASAAALTLGSHTVPVYEIYKVGLDPAWRTGLDLLGPLGLPVAVIPHYDNAEGGTHDTRFCYLGERRLRLLEAMLPTGTFVLGVDSHTALVLDLDAGTARVEGLGGVTVRAAGRSQRWAAGTVLSVADLRAVAATLAAEGDADGGDGRGGRLAEDAPPSDDEGDGIDTSHGSPFADLAATLGARVDAALATGDVPDAVRALLELDDEIQAWTADTDGSEDPDRARGLFRSLIVRLGDAAGRGGTDDRLAPLVELLLDLRDRARAARDFRQADWIRRTLADLDIEVRDGDEATSWVDQREAR